MSMPVQITDQSAAGVVCELTIETPGIQGPPGPAGSIGPAGPVGPAGTMASFVYQFQAAVTVVHVPHNLGFYPAVTVIDSGGDVLIGDIAYDDLNNLTVTLSAADSGTVYCN